MWERIILFPFLALFHPAINILSCHKSRKLCLSMWEPLVIMRLNGAIKTRDLPWVSFLFFVLQIDWGNYIGTLTVILPASSSLIGVQLTWRTNCLADIGIVVSDGSSSLTRWRLVSSLKAKYAFVLNFWLMLFSVLIFFLQWLI